MKRTLTIAALLGATALTLAGCVTGGADGAERDPRIAAETFTESTSGSAPAAGSCELSTGGETLLPDPECTPGAVTSEISAANTSPVCAAAEPAPVTDDVRSAVLSAYGVSAETRDNYRLDYLVPASLGGANDFANLWPVPLGDPAHTAKPALEAVVKDAVCGGRAGIQAAQFAFADDWSSVLEVLRLQR